MAPSLIRLALLFASVGNVWSTPVEFAQTEAVELRDNLRQRCAGQSCKIASLSGSSGRPYRAKFPPKDLNDAGYCCIIRHNPPVRKRLERQTGVHCPAKRSIFEPEDEMMSRRAEEDVADDAEMDLIDRAACKPNIVIFAKGTGDTGPIGTSVGPALKQALDSQAPGQWAVHGVIYRNDETGNACVGLPGGARAAKVLERVHRKCPHTKIVMSGYSQGAMVARNGIAYSNPASHANLKALLTFGDPFNGAPVKSFGGPLIVFCAKGDKVCRGRNIVTAAHSSYAGADTNRGAARIIKAVH